MPRYLILLLFAGGLLQGCAAPSRDSCQETDWYAIGYTDGLRGHRPAQISHPRESCLDRAPAAGLARYREGHEAGLQHYCTPGNGYRLGVKGQDYTGACPVRSEPEFLQAWSVGKAIHDTEIQLQRLNEILAVNLEQLERLEQARQMSEGALAQSETSQQQRLQLYSELNEIEETRALAEDEIRELEAAILQERTRLQTLREKARRWDNAGQTSLRPVNGL